jgi:hypothetical protein
MPFHALKVLRSGEAKDRLLCPLAGWFAGCMAKNCRKVNKMKLYSENLKVLGAGANLHRSGDPECRIGDVVEACFNPFPLQA